MADHQESYQSPFSQRYAGEQMQALFSPMHRARLFRQLWLILAQCQQQLGLPVSDEQIRELSARVRDVDLQRVNELEQSLRHDVMAHLKAYAEDCPLAAPILHLGATSCYVTDNADILILRDAMRLVQARLVGTARA
ncbi:MAG TPA: adenylosuccinate lyase, partial [Clostridia bacterium]|nr:adenylosuccinate lyase [Clostridia bacterium]